MCMFSGFRARVLLVLFDFFAFRIESRVYSPLIDEIVILLEDRKCSYVVVSE